MPAEDAEAPGELLLVEDDHQLRRLYARALVKAGHRVATAASGSEAIDLARKQRFDAVISDVHMAGMSGVALLRDLHALDADLPVLLVTGEPELRTAMQAVEHGALEYIPKPLTLDHLRSSAARAIALRRRLAKAQQALEHYRSGARQREDAALPGQRELVRGDVLGGRYRIVRLLGRGGMGVVYEAEPQAPPAPNVAVKVLHPSLAADPAFLIRFRREAETAKLVEHPSIVRILDCASEDDGSAFLVMELLEGMSVRQAIVRQGQLSAERTTRIAAQVLGALAAAHEAHVVHRDIKPDNVFLGTDPSGRDVVKILDFGVAKLLTRTPGQTLTQAGTIVGTPAYMAPEHARGAPADQRSDLYSLGAVMYEALGGRPPFDENNYHALLLAIQAGTRTPLSELRRDLDPALAAVVERAMALDPAARYQSADEMLAAVRPWCD